MPKQVAPTEDGAADRVRFGTAVSGFEEDLYGASNLRQRRAQYDLSIDPNQAHEHDLLPPAPKSPHDAAQESNTRTTRPTLPSISAPRHLLEEADAAAAALHSSDPFAAYAPRTVAASENPYIAAARKRGVLNSHDVQARAEPAPDDPPPSSSSATALPHALPTQSFATPAPDDQPPAPSQPLNRQKHIEPAQQPAVPPARKRRRRWDVSAEDLSAPSAVGSTQPSAHGIEKNEPTPVSIEPVQASAIGPLAPASGSRWDAPAKTTASASVSSRWDNPTKPANSVQTRSGIHSDAQAAAATRSSRWDAPPVPSILPSTTAKGAPHASGKSRESNGSLIAAATATGETRVAVEKDPRNRPLTDAELDALLPSEGYTILEPPEGYVPNRSLAHRLLHTGSGPVDTHYQLPAEGGLPHEAVGVPVEMPDALKGISLKSEDYQHFAKILDKKVTDADVSEDELVERRIMRLLLKIKNGAPSIRKVAMRQISERAREFGAAPLLKQLLPLLMSPSLEHQERHLYVKVIDRILYKLNDLIRPHVQKILVVIEPMLIDDDYYARVEGREIISNLAKVAGLATMISAMRPDIDHKDEFVRNTTARAFAVVTSALGIPSMLLFLRAVCGSKKSWEARHTGIKIVQQVAMLMGVAVLPHLNELVEVVRPGLTDDQVKVRLVSAYALASLAEASAPYGIESFDSVLKPLWEGMRLHRGQTLAAFLKAIGYIIPLMDAEYANYYAKEVNRVLIREFKSPDEDMKSVVLKVIVQCVACSGLEPSYVRDDVAPEFFRCFWVRRIALDRRNFKAVVDATLQIAIKIGGAEVIGRLVDDLKDESDPYRRMVVETIEKIADKLGLSDIDSGLESRLLDGSLYAFQEQSTAHDSGSALKALSTVVEKLHLRAKPYMEQIVGIVKWRLNNKNTKIREQAADLISKIAPVMKACDEDALMAHMGTVLFEYLGEEFPDVLGSILRAMKSIVEVIGIEDMQPPVNELLPRLTPILKNRHEKVQENCIILVGKIASKGARFISSKEWMRICFELLELLKAPRKAIRKSAVATFGFIAKAIGPSNVLTTLLNNLKVQERTQRVCTTVAIAIVAETCEPYTVLPSLMNEYRIPELHVQNGILKSLSFLFEYIGPMSGDYIYSLLPILEDALIDRDLVHRQTACTAVGHLALGVRGLGVEDALIHLLNHVWPNIFETSPHVINAVMSAIQGCTVALGAGPMLLYLIQGLFHPAKKVREVYWRIYNSVYVYAQESLVPFYPSMTTPDIDPDEDDPFGPDRYERRELYLMI